MPESRFGPGDAIGPYTVESRIGAGSVGEMYVARTGDGDRVTVKVVKDQLAGDESFLRRFEREARSTARVSHPRVSPVVDSGVHQGLPYVVRRYIPGRSLEQRIRDEGPLPVDDVLALCRQVAEGLEAIHDAGMVHRELKPSNIVFDEDGAAVITDLGLAKDREASMLTRAGQALGALEYIAPEQIRGRGVCAASDVYALGCVVFECLAGHPPFADRQGMRVLWAHMQEAPPDPCAERPDAPPRLSAAVRRALEKEPEDRPQSAGEYARLLLRSAEARP